MMKKRRLETAIKEVTRGYELTTQLRSLLERLQPLQVGLGSELGVIFEEVQQALTASISILNSVADKDGGSPELGSACSINRGIKGSGESTVADKDGGSPETILSSAAGHGNQRHRRINNKRHQQSWTEITRVLKDDGYQWRKYGQKDIHNSKHPRCYYRCTHSDGQSCPAAKQVQQKDGEDPPMFLITYINHHTCCNPTTTTITTTTTTAQPSVYSNPPATELQPFSLTIGTNTKRALALECSGQMYSWQAATWPSSNHLVSMDQPTHRSVGVGQEPLSFKENVCGGLVSLDQPIHGSVGVDQEPLPSTAVVGGRRDADIFSSPLRSPISYGWVMDYLLRDTPGSELNEVEPLLNMDDVTEFESDLGLALLSPVIGATDGRGGS